MKVHYSELRRKIKLSQKYVMDSFLKNHNVSLCFFCGCKSELTKEHVLPQWFFEKKADKFFSATINDIPQNYMQATIPACSRCNNVLLSSIEDTVISILENVSPEYYTDEQKNLLIWWLELIGFKLQVLDLRRKFLKSKEGPYIPYLANIPLGIMRGGAVETPYQIFLGVRQARRKLIKIRKKNEHNSLVIFNTSNPDMHFFHKSGKLIFLELPKYGVALFHFYNEKFSTPKKAHSNAMDIIKRVY